MDIRKLQRAIVDGLEDVKAQNIQVFNTEHLSPLFERVIIASGTSNRQTKALASSVRDAVKAGGMQVMRTEGEDNGEWIIVDCGAAVAHIMQPGIRDYYHLEEIWGGKAVRMKIDGSGPLPMAAREAAVANHGAKAPAKKGAVKKATAPAKKTPAKKTVAKKAVAKTATAKPPARKPAAPAKHAGRTLVVNVAAKKPAAKKPAAKKAAAPARGRRG
jgi:ribosome-associated protein